MNGENKMKHTPGPWKANGKGGFEDGGSSSQHPCFVGDIIGANGQTIVGRCTFLSVQGLTPEQAEANAKLIAGAPELLETLADICLHAVGNNHGSFNVSADRIRLARELVIKTTRQQKSLPHE